MRVSRDEVFNQGIEVFEFCAAVIPDVLKIELQCLRVSKFKMCL